MIRGGILRRRLKRATMDGRFLNVLQLGVGFMLMFTSFNSQGFIEETVLSSISAERQKQNGTIDQISKDAGYYSLAIIYASFTLCNFLAAPTVNLLGAKWSMVIGACCYTAFLLSFLRLTEWLLYLLSALLGLGAGMIWTGQGNYLTLNSDADTISRNSGILWAMLQSAPLFGGIFLYIVDRLHVAGEKGDEISTGSVRLIYGIFSGGAIIATIVFALLRSPPQIQARRPADAAQLVESLSADNSQVVDSVVQTPAQTAESKKAKFPSGRDLWKEFSRTFKLLLTMDMGLLAVVFFYTGLVVTMWTGVYPTMLARTALFGVSKLSMIAFNAICTGLGEIIGGALFGIFGNRTNQFGRNPIILLGCSIHLVAYFLIFINLPMESPIRDTSETSYLYPNVGLALFCGFLLGFGDACWSTQIYSLLGSLYSEESAPAFALYKLFQSLAACFGFFYGPHFALHWQLIILTVFAFAGSLAFFPVEWEAQIKPQGVKVK